jgi:autotransporter passenger strand-loop-strand repeat protein
VLSGGIEVVSSGGTAGGTTISSGGLEVVSSGGTESGTIVNRGGTLELFGGAVADLSGTTVISAGGTLEIRSGFALSGFEVKGSSCYPTASVPREVSARARVQARNLVQRRR